jgi:hypothetical protein
MRLAAEREDWIPVLRAAAAEAKRCEPYGGEFAGRWVLQRLGRLTGQGEWRPGLRLLAAYGLIEKSGETVRGGRRAYWKMPDRQGVEEALRELQSDAGAELHR